MRGQSNIIAGYAQEAASESGLVTCTFATVELALESIVDNGPELIAAVCSLDQQGRRNNTGGREPLGMPILRLAANRGVPVVLLSEYPDALDYATDKPNFVVVPKEPYERIAPALSVWFQGLVT